MLPGMNVADDLKFIQSLARDAGKIVLHHYGKVERLTKRQDEAVTEADRATQRFIVDGLRKQFPADGLVGEENDDGSAITFEVRDPAGRNWVIDPIDGTNNFVAGMNNFAVCIGLLDAGRPVLGVVYDVTRDHLYAAAKGEGAWRNSDRIAVTDAPLGPSSMLMMTSNLLDAYGKTPAWACRWIGQTEWKTRILGSAALEAIAVANGAAAAAITVNGKLWDVAAPAAVVLEAGGVVTDLKGLPVFPFDLRNYSGAKVPFIAAAPQAHPVLLREMAEHP